MLFKFLTFREAISNPSTMQVSSQFVKPRKIQIIILQSSKQPYTTVEVNVVPTSTPIDHTFRFYESEKSHVTLLIPPFLQLNHPGLHAIVSKPTAVVDIDKTSASLGGGVGSIKIETRTEEAPSMSEMTLFIYGD